MQFTAFFVLWKYFLLLLYTKLISHFLGFSDFWSVVKTHANIHASDLAWLLVFHLPTLMFHPQVLLFLLGYIYDLLLLHKDEYPVAYIIQWYIYDLPLLHTWIRKLNITFPVVPTKCSYATTVLLIEPSMGGPFKEGIGWATQVGFVATTKKRTGRTKGNRDEYGNNQWKIRHERGFDRPPLSSYVLIIYYMS